jgi:hypothetical protein
MELLKSRFFPKLLLLSGLALALPQVSMGDSYVATATDPSNGLVDPLLVLQAQAVKICETHGGLPTIREAVTSLCGASCISETQFPNDHRGTTELEAEIGQKMGMGWKVVGKATPDMIFKGDSTTGVDFYYKPRSGVSISNVAGDWEFWTSSHAPSIDYQGNPNGYNDYYNTYTSYGDVSEGVGPRNHSGLVGDTRGIRCAGQ